jgi:hypothetical protein
MLIIISIMILFTIITLLRLLSNRKWKLFYTAFGYDKYFSVVSALKAANVKFKTNTPIGSIRNRELVINDYTQYDIYVTKDDECRAAKALKNIY